MAESYLRLPNTTTTTSPTTPTFDSWHAAYTDLVTKGYPTLQAVIHDVPVKITQMETIFASEHDSFRLPNIALRHHPDVVLDSLAARERRGVLEPKVANVIMRQVERADEEDPTNKRRG